ncbi:MAG TPA: hypothetical protein VN669_10450 [Candidatus Acidoferrales bacterium]|nr:hypothetical protein [Candidatus Acidoferrales bacterium]
MRGISVRICFALFFVLISLSFLPASGLVVPVQAPQAQTSGPKIWLGQNQPIAIQQTGAFATVSGTEAAGPQPLSIGAGDIDGDGVADLVVGYNAGGSGVVSIFRGNLDALAPQSDESLQGVANGQFPAPFKAEALSIPVPITPDFLVLGDFVGKGKLDLIVAARGGTAFYVLAGDGKGNFSDPQTVKVQGGITALAADKFGSLHRQTIVVGTKTGLQVFSKTPQGLTAIGSYSLPAAPSNVLFGEFGDPGPDAAFLSGGKVYILRSSSMKVEPVALPVNAVAMALGGFIYDRNSSLQIALLASDGSIQIAAHNEFDSRPLSASELQTIRAAGLRGHQNPLAPVHAFPVNGWKIVETFPSVGTVAPGIPPVFFRGRVSANGADDIVWLNASRGQMVVISHANLPSDALTFVPGEIATRPYNGAPMAAVSVWVNVDARPGIVAIDQGETLPSLMMPLPDPTFTVNRTDDPTPVSPIGNACNGVPNDCSLREAILKANSISGADTIILPAGTYTLTIPRVAGDFSGQHGTLEITDTVTITGAVDGAGAPISIIQAGTTNANGVDKIMSINQDIGPLTTASANLSNLVLRFGRNLGNALTLQDGFGGAFDFDIDNSGATLTITNCTITDNQTTDGEGGGFEVFNTGGTAATTGFAQIGNSTVQNNKTRRNPANGDPNAAGNGGGITIAFPARLIMQNTNVLNNDATQVQGTGIGTAGGLFLIGGSNFDNPTSITGGTISGNKSAGDGGGIWATSGLTISGGTVISNNTAGTSGAGSGGGIWFNAASPRTGSITHSTIVGNAASATAGNGGGIEVSTGAGLSLTLTANRIAGNTAHTGSNLDWQSVAGATVNAANNWWGTNLPSATINKVGSGTLTSDPFYVLTHKGVPAKIRINQSATLTGDLGHDNHGTAIAAANLDQIVGLPITFAPDSLGSIPQAQPETLNASAQATATFNAGGTSGRANPTAGMEPIGGVDQVTALANDSLIASATEAGTTVTITTVGAHGFSAGETAVISGVGVSGYNGTFIINATPTITTFTYTDPTAGLGASSGGTANVGIVVLEPPQITKSFGAARIPVNGTTTLSFSINNPNVVAINTSFTDTLPVGLQVASTPGVTNTCGGTVTATAGSGTISFSNNLTPVGACSISVNITGTVDNNYTNSVTIDSTDAGNGNTSSANLTVIDPPTIAKAFGASTIPLNGTTSLTFTLTSANQNLSISGAAFTDNLPAGLVVAPTPNLNNTCGGTATATAGASSVSLSGATLAPGASCTVSANVQGTTGGVKNNSVQVTSINAGTGNTSNASVTVVAPPVIDKAFGAASIPLNGSTSLSFTISNPNVTAALSGVAFTDTLPAGLVISTPNGLTGSCGTGTVTATQGTNVISLSGGTLAANASCTFSVNVTGITAGTQNNTTGNVTSVEGGTGGTASASINVVAPPSIAKVFNPAEIGLNATTSLTFTITNPAANTASLTGVAFTDTLPTGLTVASATATVCGGTLTTTAPTGIALSGATIAANSQCQFSVTVTGAASGQYTNTTGNVTSTNGGTGNTASANLTVASPPAITKVFGATTIPLNGTTSLTFTIQNPNTGLALTGLAFTDNLPAGLVVAPTPGLSNTCAGTATAAAGASSVTLSGGTLAAGASCTVAVTVQGVTAGVKNNSVQVTSTEAGTGNTSNASLTVVSPPALAKTFGAASIPLNGSTSLSFTISNPNLTAALSGVAFSDTLPAGLVISTPNGLTGSCGTGTITATQGTNVISLSGGTLAANASCTFSVNVTGITAGTQNNTTGNVTSVEGSTGGTASASVNVVAPPSVAKVFNPSTINVNATTSLTFTITNPTANTAALTGVAFTDTLPTGLTVASGTATVCGETLTTTAPTGIALSGATITANGQCQFSVTVTGAAAGNFTNTTGNVTSTNGGTGNTGSANLTVKLLVPVITKGFGAASIPLNGSTSLSFTIQNQNPSALTGVAFSDTLPAGLVVATPNGLTGSCGAGTISATAGTNAISLSGGTLAANTSCTFAVNVKGIAAGTQNNTTGNVTSTETGPGNTASATIKVVAPPSIAKVFAPSAITLNATTSLTFTITNPAANVDALTGVAFTDTLPTGLTVANATATVCGGTLTTTAPTGISLSGATLAVNSQCQFSVTVTGAASGQYTNTTGAVTSTNGGTGNTASANLTVASPPSITKTFGATTIPLKGTTSLTFSISNPNTTLALSGIAFSDNLPAGLVVASTPNLSNACGGTATAVGGSGSVSLSAGTLAAGASCTVSVNVQGTTAGVKNNSVQVTSTEAGTGNTSNASLTVVSPPAITKAFGAASIPLNGSTSLSFTISNPNLTTALSGVSFSDTLPAGLVISTPNGFTGSCGTGTITATQGTNVISLSGGTLAANASCTFSVNVTGIAAGTQNNTTSAVTSNEAGTGGTASASINVVAPPSIAKVFNPANIALNATTSLTFTITNPAANSVALAGVAFTDTLPTGLTVANSTSTVCGGTLTTTAPTGIALSGATIAANAQCQFSVTVTGAAAGQYTNTTGAVTSTNGGTGNTASANLSVATPPSITKAFGAANILLNQSTSVTFTITNPNTTLALSGVAFTDALPAGLVVSTPNGLNNTCAGTVTAAAGSGSITLSGGSVAANGSCTLSVKVTGVAAGVQNNTTGPVSSTQTGAGAGSNTATVTVIGPPSIAKAFGAASINLNQSTTLSFTITNPNATVALSGVAFTDALPAGLVVANPNGLTGSCGSGTITTSASSVSLTGGTIAAGGSCTFSVNVTGTTSGHKVNTTGTVTSTNAGSGNQATASIDVLAPDPTITKTHSGTFKRGQTGAQWTITVSNVGFGPTSGTVTVVDTLPNIPNPPVPTAISGTGWTCTLATLTCTRSDALASGSSYPPITLTVNIPQNIRNSFTNTAKVSGGGDVNPNNNTATDPINLGPPIVLTPQSSSTSARAGGSASMVISVDAPDPTLGAITFSCSGLPTASACLFNPILIDPSVTPGPTNITVSVVTAKSSASFFVPERPGRRDHAPLFAMWSLPFFGIVLTGLGGKRRKRFIRWSVPIFVGLLLLLALVGCGAAPAQPVPVHGTPAGTFTITVSATSTATATNPSFTATSSFDLVVQ